MAKHRASGDDPLTGEEVTEGPEAAYWSVDDSRWPAVRPDLPAHMVDLLAPPIVVGVARVPATSRLTPPAEHRRNAPADHRLGPPAEQRRNVPAEQRRNVPAEQRRNVPAEQRRNVPAEQRSAPVVGPRTIVPAAPGGSGRRPAGAPASAGRHRLPAK
ncbi:hypothetical protein ACGF5C_27650 [Micromonospora sp. NPDC047620]|uniref:hypothetical protein n=1 Tax=Micromonospora sp. NPDC047620 TaxID=3364251 RepID=UPI003715F69D